VNPLQHLGQLFAVAADKISSVFELPGLKRSCLGYIDGVAICDPAVAQASKDAFLDLTRQAMALIKSFDARRYRRVCRYLHYIANSSLLTPGQYRPTLQICRVDYAKNFNSIYYPQRNVRTYAGVLIHEATHGLLFEKGIPYDEKKRERVERLCHLESYRFALHFEPGYADLFPGPYNPEGHKWHWESSFKARLVAWQKRFQEAERASNPKSAQDYNERSATDMQKGDYDKAIADCDEAIRLDPQLAAAYNNRGSAYLWKRDYDKAIADCDLAIRLNPKDARAHTNRGIAYLFKRDYDKAIADCDLAIQLNSKDARAHMNRGTAYLQKRDYDKAIADYDLSIQHNPREATAHNNLAWLLATCPQISYRDGKRAVEHATKACALYEWKKPDAVKTLAAAYGEVGDFENAVKWERQFLGTPDQIARATLNAESRLSLYQAHKRYYEVK